MRIFNICVYKIKDFFKKGYKEYKNNSNKNNNMNSKNNKKKILVIAIILVILGVSCVCAFIFKKDKVIFNNKCKNIVQEDNKDEEAQEELIARQKIIYQKYQEKKLICLTFDDGPGEYTKLLIDGLKQRSVNATFFVLGQNISKHTEYIEESYRNGNEIGIHGYSHKLFTKLKNEQIIDEITRASKELYNITGTKPNLIRVPYGSLNSRVKEVVKSQNLQSILWTVDSRDWKYKNTDKDYNYVIKKVKGNDIILMHDIYKPSVMAAFKIIDELSKEGYMFVTISEYSKCVCDDE